MGRIEVGQYSTLLRRLLNMAGESHVSDELSPEISPVLTLESERPEWLFLKNEKLMGWTQNIPADATKNNGVRIRNPTGSGVVAVMLEINAGADAATGFTVLYGASTTDLGTVSGTVPRDGRYLVLNSALIASFANDVSGLSGIDQCRVAANDCYKFNQPIVIVPGFAVQVVTNAVNLTTFMGFCWRERRLDDLERS